MINSDSRFLKEEGKVAEAQEVRDKSPNPVGKAQGCLSAHSV